MKAYLSRTKTNPNLTRGRRFVRWLGRLARTTGIIIFLLAALIGFKALQNKRDVVALAPFDDHIAAYATIRLPDFRIIDPYDAEGHWYKVQLHTHTDRSIDGRWSVAESLAAYANAGYGFVAITDHDKVTLPESVPDGLLVIPAEENTVSFPFWPLGQHAIHLFASEHVLRGSASERFEAMRSQGGLISIAHPNWPGNLGSGVWEVRHLMAAPQFTLMEIYNSHSDYRLDTQTWHEVVVRRGPDAPVWAVAVDDAHDLELFDGRWTMVKAEEHSLAAIKAALERGSLYPSTGISVSFGVIEGAITVAAADDGQVDPNAQYEVVFINVSGDVVHRHQGALPSSYVPNGAEGFVRVEVRSLATGKRAWSQPFWLRAGAEES